MSCSQSDIAMLESRYFSDDSPHGLFRQCRYTIISYLLWVILLFTFASLSHQILL